MSLLKKKKDSSNYLDFIPQIASSLRWHLDEEEKVVLEIENTGWMNRIAQKLFHRPKVTQVHLDEMGTFVWPLIDGARTVNDIAILVKKHFGEKAEPLYPRIVKYFQIVESYHFIDFINKNGK